jgi:hypothetical protein
MRPRRRRSTPGHWRPPTPPVRYINEPLTAAQANALAYGTPPPYPPPSIVNRPHRDADIDDAAITDTAGNPILTTEPGMRITVDLPRTQAAKLGLRLIWRAITGRPT